MSGAARRRRTRPVPLLLGVLLAVGLLLRGIDWLARQGAESLLAEELQQVTGTLAPVTVEVQGGPVLLQALRGRYEEVEVTMREVSNGPLTLDRVHAELRGVHLSLHDLLIRDADAVVIEEAVTDARLGYDALDQYLGFTGRSLTVRPAAAGEIRVTGTGQVLNRSYEATAEAEVDPEGPALLVRPTALRTEPELDRAARLLLAERFRFRVPLDPLPFGEEVLEVEAGESTLDVRTAGAGIVLRT